MNRLIPFAALALSCAPPLAPAAAPATSPSLAAEARAILEELVNVDTSHGHETDALKPVASRFRAAGIPFELVESAPGRGNLVARIKGSGAKRPLLLLAHVDVVPVEGQPWTVPPFKLTEKDGFLWGRGVNDDKQMAADFAAIALSLARSKTPLSRDVIVALTADEELGGFAGVRWLLANRKDLLDAEIALNEGAGIRLDPTASKIVSVGFGVSEKTYQSYRLAVQGVGGHSSVPPTDVDPATVLARALVKIGEHKFPPYVRPEVAADLLDSAQTAKPEVAAALRSAAKSAPSISEEDEKVLARDRRFNALIRTTCVTTQLKGSPRDNVLPTTAEAVINCRLLPGQSIDETTAALEKVIGDPRVTLAKVDDHVSGPAMPVDGEVPRAIAASAHRVFPGAPVVPSMGTGTTDSRHLRNAGIAAYAVSPLMVTDAEARTGHVAHGPDERAYAKWLGEGARFLEALTLELAR